MSDKSYQEFLHSKTQFGCDHGFEPLWMPDKLFDFQKHLVEWACRKGRAAIFADCGLGKTFMQLVWAENVVRKTNGRVLILTPLAVAFQTVQESKKIGIESVNRRDGINAEDKIVITNYERLHYFNPVDFAGVVCDESSILKNFDGQTRHDVTIFMRKVQYRLLCTATAAPNDYMELGTSSECLGELGYTDMISKFFKKVEKTLSRKDEHRGNFYRFRGHSEEYFWRWVCSWARAMRKPSDLGFSNDGFVLPKLNINKHIVSVNLKPDGFLFEVNATDLLEQRQELRRSLGERCELAAFMTNTKNTPSVCWCHLNDEAKTLHKLIPDSAEISGSDTEERKEDVFRNFSEGNIRVLITKPKIAGFGLNWQHCSHQVYFPSHSYEQYYQAIRRCWRFGQKKPVTVDLISTEGQSEVLKNLERKADAALKMFDNLIMLMREELKIKNDTTYDKKEEIPSWL